MEDFNDLASSFASGVSDVRACLIVSRDGLVLGAHPDEGERQVKLAWLRFATLGDPERGFAQFGMETWCYVRRGPYAAFAVTGPGVRPGLVIDHMEQVLLLAEEARSRPEGIRSEPAAPSALAPSGKPRTPLHPDPRPFDEPVVIPAGSSVPDETRSAPPTEPGAPPAPVAASPHPEPAPPETPSVDPAVPVAPASPARTDLAHPSRTAPGPSWEEEDEGDDVDRFSLAREFGQLLQDDRGGADA